MRLFMKHYAADALKTESPADRRADSADADAHRDFADMTAASRLVCEEEMLARR
jgi:hypothetical protein